MDEASRPVSYPATLSVPLVCHARAALESQLAAAPIGLAVRGLTKDEAQAAGLAGPAGAIVTRTGPGSRADRGGVRPGDIVLRCDDADVAGAAELEAVVRNAGSSRPLRIFVWRERQVVELALPAKAPTP